jgi:hypothetical protein
MWSVDVILRGAPTETITHGLRQSLKHLRKLGLDNSSADRKLTQLKQRAEASLDMDLTPQVRNDFAKELGAIIGTVGDLAAAGQPDFRDTDLMAV